MKKAEDLRKHLIARVPELKKHPDKLHVFVEKGRIATQYGESLSFAYHFDLNLVITDYSAHADTLIVPLLAWIKAHYPSALFETKRLDELIKFEAEIIDNEKSDISITVELDESVIVTVTSDNKYRCEHLPDIPLDDMTGAPLLPPPGTDGAGWPWPGRSTPSPAETPYSPTGGGIIFIDVNTGEAA